MSPSFAPTSMNAAITSVYSVIALWTPVTVVFRSTTICEIDTFITLESSTMMNWADARMTNGSHFPPAVTPREQRRAAPRPQLALDAAERALVARGELFGGGGHRGGGPGDRARRRHAVGGVLHRLLERVVGRLQLVTHVAGHLGRLAGDRVEVLADLVERR